MIHIHLCLQLLTFVQLRQQNWLIYYLLILNTEWFISASGAPELYRAITIIDTALGRESLQVYIRNTKTIQKVYACNPRPLFVPADYWFLVFSVMLESCLMQLYVEPCYVVSAEIAVARAVPIEVRGVIRFLQGNEFLGYLVEDTSSRV